MITTVTLNAAVDKVLIVDRFAVDKVNRVKELSSEPGGKGNNAAKVARLLGADVTACGLLGGENGRYVHRELSVREIISEPIWIEGTTREALTILDPLELTQTEILEPGPTIEPRAWAELRLKVAELAKESNVVCFCGSIPPGLGQDAYAELVAVAKAGGALTILDTSGEALLNGLESSPYLVKPNRDELQQLTGSTMRDTNDIIEAARMFIRNGTKAFIVSLDEDGSLLVTEDEVWAALPLQINVVNTVGCGDALVGGIACYLDHLGRGSTPDSGQIAEALRWGTAAAASNAQQLIAGHVDLTEYTELIARAEVVPVS